MGNWTDYFEFDNFSPSASQAKVLRKALEDLFWIAPSDSTVKILVRKKSALFCVRGSVASAIGQFAAEGLSEDFQPALRIMESGLQREINRWKKARKITEESEIQKQVS